MDKVSRTDRILGGLWGAIVGDALGVPVEFTGRSVLSEDPVTGMREYGTHNQPKGTWSDDSSLLLCTVESLLEKGFDMKDMGKRFAGWYLHGNWTPWGRVFDIGGTTHVALSRITDGVEPEHAGGKGENDNGNGSLMRILPVPLFLVESPVDTMLDAVHRVSAITHGHPRSQMACGFYSLLARHLFQGRSPDTAYARAVIDTVGYYDRALYKGEMHHFDRVLSGEIGNLHEDAVNSGGYVIDTLEASIWCLLDTDTYSDAVLRAVNLGGDTDTTACVTGGLAGVWYGRKAIPVEWIEAIAGKEDIERLLNSFVRYP